LPTPVPAGAIRHTGGCLQPVLLRGRADYIDGGTGELIHRYTTVHEPGGVLPIACKTRRASRCPPCAEIYRADTYQLIRAGLTGGKGIPATVADNPCVFVTLTAPSFGPVHARRDKDGRSWPADHAGKARHVRTASGCPAARSTPGMTTGLASRCARTATTTPARSCSMPAPPNCGAASSSPCDGPWPARPGSLPKPLTLKSGSRTPRSPNTNAAASSTSTPSSASMAPPDPPRPRPPGQLSPCSPPPSTRPPVPSGSPRPPRRGSRPARWPGGASSIYGRLPPAAT